MAELNGLGQVCEFSLERGLDPSMQLLAFLRLIALSGPDAFLLEAIFRNAVSAPLADVIPCHARAGRLAQLARFTAQATYAASVSALFSEFLLLTSTLAGVVV